MLKQKVAFIQPHNHNKDAILVTTVPSTIGKTNHGNTLVRSSALQSFGRQHDLKVGDILRCDGLPFKVRPYDGKDIYNSRNKTWERQYKYPGYRSVQLKSGYWVLRSIDNK